MIGTFLTAVVALIIAVLGRALLAPASVTRSDDEAGERRL
jgi:hypothetical protein